MTPDEAQRAEPHQRYPDAEGRDTARVTRDGTGLLVDSLHLRLDGWGQTIARRRFVRQGTTWTLAQADSALYGHRGELLQQYQQTGGTPSAPQWQSTTTHHDAWGTPIRQVGPQQDTTLRLATAGRLHWERSPEGRWTHTLHDDAGRPIRTITLSRSNSAALSLTAQYPTSTQYIPSGHDRIDSVTLDPAGRILRRWTGRMGALVRLRGSGWDAQGRITADTTFVSPTSSTGALITRTAYYPDGQVDSIWRSGGLVTKYLYDDQLRRIAQLEGQEGVLRKDTAVVWGYDLASRLVSTRIPGLGRDTVVLDAADRAVRTSDSTGVWRGIGYDPLSRPIADTLWPEGLGGPAIVSRMRYGALADTTWDRSNRRTIVRRDLLGRTTQIIDADDNPTTFTYLTDMDTHIQRDSVHYPDGRWEVTHRNRDGVVLGKREGQGEAEYSNSTATFADDWGVQHLTTTSPGKPTVQLTEARDALGRVRTLERREGTELLSSTKVGFDLAGRVLADTQWTTQGNRIVSYQYLDAQRKVQITTPGGTVVERTQDARGRLHNVRLGTTDIATWHRNGNRSGALHYGNGLQAEIAQDAAGRSQGATWRKGTEALLQENLQWDLAGRLRTAVRTELPDHSQNFGPDNDGQLVEWKRGTASAQGTITTPTQQQNWTLDNRGNWTQLQSTGAPTETRTHDAGNTLLTRGTQDISHDAGGYLTSDGQRTLTWSADGLLRTVTLSDARTVEYTYDGQKRLQTRTLRNAQGDIEERTHYTWSRWQLIEEATASQTRTYAYGEYIDDAVAVQVSGAGTYWYHRTLNYTTQALSNSTGNLVEAYAVKPYGTYRVILPGPDGQLGTADDTEQGHSSVGNGRVFQGLPIQDPLTGFVHARNRWYSPELGRWVSRDPMGMVDGVNVYAFVKGVPQAHVDNSGTIAVPVGLSLLKCKDKSEGNGLVHPIYASLYARLFITSDPLASRLLSHYFNGNGSAFYLTSRDLEILGIESKFRKDFNEVGSLTCQCGQESSHTGSSLLPGSTEYAKTRRKFGLLGAYDIDANWQLDCQCDGSYSISANMQVYDWWDFDPRPLLGNPNEKRTVPAEMAVRAMQLTCGDPFPVYGDLNFSLRGKKSCSGN